MREFFALIGLLLPLFIAGGFGWSHWNGVEAVPAYAWAAGVCLFFGALAILVQEIAFRMENSFAGTLGSIVARTFGPIMIGVFVKQNLPNLVEHRFFRAFVACFLLTLAVETILSVRLVNRWEKLHSKGNDKSGIKVHADN